jgi:hypothetical protein
MPRRVGPRRTSENDEEVFVRQVLTATVLALVLTACGGTEPVPEKPAEPEPTSSGEVPTETLRVYFATVFACSRMDEVEVVYTPAVVEGSDFRTTVEPVQDCRELEMVNSYVYDVPVPDKGEIAVAPGNQPAVDLDVRKDFKNGAVTVFYARINNSSSEVTVVRPAKDPQVQGAL